MGRVLSLLCEVTLKKSQIFLKIFCIFKYCLYICIRKQKQNTMKVRFTYWNKEHAEDFKTIAPRIKKIAKVEVINSCEFIVTFKPGTKY